MKIHALAILISVFFSTNSFAASTVPTASLTLTGAKKAADTDPACKDIQPFYWEIGDKNHLLGSGTAGDGSVNRQSKFAVASASKWIFGAYVVERNKGKIDSTTAKFLHMASGYNSMPALSCARKPTVQACLNVGDNSKFTPANEGHFFYNGAHFQKWAVDHGLGPLDRDGLAAEYKKLLGAEIPIEVNMLQPAGGIKTSAEGYAVFLQKILNGRLIIRDHLGENPICTLPSACPGQALRSPVRAAWHYSYGHWVEDDSGGDGTFSSPGAFGFYPWIDKSKIHYGIISRHRATRGEDGGAGYASALCGRKIRDAFFAR